MNYYMSKDDFMKQYNTGIRKFWDAHNYFQISGKSDYDYVQIQTIYSSIKVSNTIHAIYRVFSLWQNGEIE